MAIQSTDFTIGFEIVFEHDTVLNLTVVTDAIFRIRNSIESASIHQIRGLNFEHLGFPEEIRERIYGFIREHRDDSLWLEAVEPGSSKFRGKIVGLSMVALAFFASDVVRETKHYKQLVHWSAEQADTFVEWLITDVRKNKDIRADIVGDRIRFVVIPDRRQTEIGRMLPPPIKD